MKFTVKKNQKSLSSGWFSGKPGLNLNIEIITEPTEDELDLFNKYYDPKADLMSHLSYEEDDDPEEIARIEELLKEGECSLLLSDFYISLSTDNGFTEIEIFEDILSAAEKSIETELKKLKKISSWHGKDTKNIDT